MSFPDFTDIPLDLSPWLKQATPVFLRQYRSAIPEISGNKSFKLSGWLNVHRPGQTLVSFGGAYSNHLLALAAAAPHTVGNNSWRSSNSLQSLAGTHACTGHAPRICKPFRFS